MKKKELKRLIEQLIAETYYGQDTEGGDGYSNEFQRAFAHSQATTPRYNDTKKAKELAKQGKYVVLVVDNVHCKSTDAVLGQCVSIHKIYDNKEEAYKEAEKLEGHSEGVQVIGPEDLKQKEEPPVEPTSNDEIPFQESNSNKKKKICFHCKKSRPCACDKYDDENQEASNPTSPNFDWKKFGGPKQRPSDYREVVDSDEPAGWNDLAEVVANDPQLLKQMGKEGLTEVDLDQSTRKFFQFVVRHLNDIKAKGKIQYVMNVQDLEVDWFYEGGGTKQGVPEGLTTPLDKVQKRMDSSGVIKNNSGMEENEKPEDCYACQKNSPCPCDACVTKESSDVNEYPKRRHPNCVDTNCRTCLEDHDKLLKYFEKRIVPGQDWLRLYRKWLDDNKIPAEVNGWASQEAFEPDNIESFIKDMTHSVDEGYGYGDMSKDPKKAFKGARWTVKYDEKLNEGMEDMLNLDGEPNVDDMGGGDDNDDGGVKPSGKLRAAGSDKFVDLYKGGKPDTHDAIPSLGAMSEKKMDYTDQIQSGYRKAKKEGNVEAMAYYSMLGGTVASVSFDRFKGSWAYDRWIQNPKTQEIIQGINDDKKRYPWHESIKKSELKGVIQELVKEMWVGWEEGKVDEAWVGMSYDQISKAYRDAEEKRDAEAAVYYYQLGKLGNTSSAISFDKFKASRIYVEWRKRNEKSIEDLKDSWKNPWLSTLQENFDLESETLRPLYEAKGMNNKEKLKNIIRETFNDVMKEHGEMDMSNPEEREEVKIAKKIKSELLYARSTEQGGMADSSVRRSSALDNIEKLADALLKIHGQVSEVAPPGWEGTVKAMKKHKEIDNPWALAWSMKNKGDKSHKHESVEYDSTCPKCGNTKAIILNPSNPEVHQCSKCKHKWNPLNIKKK